MAKVAAAPAPGSLASSTSLQIGGGAAAALKIGPMVKRKTPSELRGEQLKRTNVVALVDESLSSSLLGCTKNASEVDNGSEKPDLLRNPRYTDMRMDEVYPAKKSRLRMPSVKDNVKENLSTKQPNSLKNLSLISDLVAKRRLSCQENSVTSAETYKDDVVHARQTTEKCSQSIFRSVTRISSGGDRSSGFAVADMDKALKGLVACEAPISSGLNAASSEKNGGYSSIYPGNFCPECDIPGEKVPLDFTLKTKMRLASSCSVNWIHRSIMCSSYNGTPEFISQFGCSEDANSPVPAFNSQVFSSKALHSWIYPQSTLPPILISALTSSAAEGDFLQKRHQAWDDSFRSLYYMLRKKICSLFYVCTPHFVVMFTGSDGSGRAKHQCNAYVSQSTRSLRSLFREHDICFSMPLCHSKTEQVATEDLVELSEIEKQNLGQTRRLSSLSDIDNSPQSLLAFCGNRSVHGLYDFFLNYRSFLPFLAGVDVPVLYSPMPFQNAALSAPEIRCVEVKRSDHVAASSKESTCKDGGSIRSSPSGICSSIEIKDAYIPPWIICHVCSLIRAEGGSFESSFTTEHTSVGLNAAIGKAFEISDSEDVAGKGVIDSSQAFGIPEAMVRPHMGSGFLKGLKYKDGCYTASLRGV